MNLELDANDSLSLRASGGVHQPLLTRLLPKLAKPGDFIVDVGAHIGYFTIQFAELVGDTGRVFAYEPYRHSYKTLRRNLAKYRNTITAQAAVGSEAHSVAKLFLSDHTGDNRLFDDNHRRWVAVQAVRLDDQLAYLDKIDLLKIDVQGWEGYVLQGAKNQVLPMTRKIVFEFWPTGLNKSGFGNGCARQKLFDLLEDAGFTFYDLREEENRVVLTNREELFSRYPVKEDASTENIKPGDFTDILAIGKGETFEPILP